MGEGAMAQLSDDEIFRLIDAEANSVALIVKHMAGNMRSRWTDFLTSDGEKPDRNRDTEFEMNPGTTRADVMAWWETGWKCVFDGWKSLVYPRRTCPPRARATSRCHAAGADAAGVVAERAGCGVARS